MLSRSDSARQWTATPIGVGIDTSRYGHYAAFLGPDLHTAAPDLEVIESAAGYARLRQRRVELVTRHGHVHFHVRLDAAGLYADNLLAWLGALAAPGADATGLANASFTLSCGDTQRNKNYRVAVYGHQKSDPVEARACARYALTERPNPGTVVTPELLPLRQVAGRLQAVVRQRTRLVNQLHLEQEISAALAVAHTEASDAVRDAPVKNVDETDWKQQGKKRWLWLAATKWVAMFIIHPWRNWAALEALLGRELNGILCSDRWVVYNDWPDPFARQLCWAHLKRNWQALVERGGAAKRIGERFLSIEHEVFALWHLFRGGGCSREHLVDRMLPWIDQMEDILADGLRSRDAKTQRFCARLDQVKWGLWTFVEAVGVEPTNNHGERLLRRAVLWRRRSFGCHSASGCRFAERILTVAATLRLQGRNVVNFLSDSIAAHRAGRPGPKLIAVG